MCHVLAAVVTGPACDMLSPSKAEWESKKQSPRTPVMHELSAGHVRLADF